MPVLTKMDFLIHVVVKRSRKYFFVFNHQHITKNRILNIKNAGRADGSHKKWHSVRSRYPRSVNQYHLNGSYFTCNVWQLLLFIPVCASVCCDNGLDNTKKGFCVNILVNAKKGLRKYFHRITSDSFARVLRNQFHQAFGSSFLFSDTRTFIDFNTPRNSSWIESL